MCNSMLHIVCMLPWVVIIVRCLIKVKFSVGFLICIVVSFLHAEIPYVLQKQSMCSYYVIGTLLFNVIIVISFSAERNGFWPEII